LRGFGLRIASLSSEARALSSTCAAAAAADGASLFSDASACHPKCVESSRRLLRASLFSDAFV
jgi:hypothetical protein